MLDAFNYARWSRAALWVFATLVLVFLMVPTLIVIPLSFSDSDLLEFPPRAYSLRWYASFFASSSWMGALRVSLTLGLLTALISMPLSFLAGIAITKLRGRLGTSIYGTILIPTVVPGILMAIGLFFVLAALRLIGTLPGVLIGHVVLAIPVTLIVLLPALDRFDWAQINAAQSLGANLWQALLVIMLPQIAFTLLAAALMAFLTSLDEAVISIFVSGGQNSTLPKLMFSSLRDQIDPTIAAISTLWVGVVTQVVLVLNRQATK